MVCQLSPAWICAKALSGPADSLMAQFEIAKESNETIIIARILWRVVILRISISPDFLQIYGYP
jgi:hypothetical protein